jgi:hypothetical protein
MQTHMGDGQGDVIMCRQVGVWRAWYRSGMRRAPIAAFLRNACAPCSNPPNRTAARHAHTSLQTPFARPTVLFLSPAHHHRQRRPSHSLLSYPISTASWLELARALFTMASQQQQIIETIFGLKRKLLRRDDSTGTAPLQCALTDPGSGHRRRRVASR